MVTNNISMLVKIEKGIIKIQLCIQYVGVLVFAGPREWVAQECYIHCNKVLPVALSTQ